VPSGVAKRGGWLVAFSFALLLKSGEKMGL
jgi:hypothetical protein